MGPWRALRGLVVAALVSAPLVALPASPAFAEEVYARPADGVFHMEGRGWGHGHGLSQWGSEGAARQGVLAKTILDTYYPGTAQATVADRTIRVLIGEDDHTDAIVSPASGLAVRDLASGARYTLPAGPTRWRVYADSTGEHIGFYDSGWKVWATGGKNAWTGPLQFEGPSVIRLWFGNATARDYRGVIRAVRTGTTTVNVVNALSLEWYLYGVVPRESPSSFQPEALKAQSVAARSYSSYKMDHVASGATYDICSTTSCQVYGGVRLVSSTGSVTELETTNTNNAVNATRGVVRTYGGAAIFAEFSSSNGGWSTTGSQPYLAAKADPWDAIASPHHYWTATLTAAQVEARYPSVGRLLRIRVTKRDGNGDWGGRVKEVILEGVSSSGAGTSVAATGAGIYNAHVWPTYSDGLRGSWWHIVPNYGATVVSKNAAPALVRPPGQATYALDVQYRNTGTAAWPVSGLHLALAGPMGGADPMVGGSKTPGHFVANVSRSGATDVQPGEVARFQVSLDVSSVAAGSYAKAYAVRIGTGAVFGQVAQWVVTVANPVFTASVVSVSGPPPASPDAPSPVFADGTVVVPRTGSTAVTVKVKNTGNFAWPFNAGVRLSPSDPKGRSSASSGAGWGSSSQGPPVSAVEGGGTSVKPGQVGVFTLPLYGNAGAAGVTAESFDVAYYPYRWIDGAAVRLAVTRIDTAVSRVAQRANALPATTKLMAYPGDKRTFVVRLRNLGRDPWPVAGSEVMTTANPANRQDALRGAGWLSPSVPGRVYANVSRPGTGAVYPGEVAEYRVAIDPTNKAVGTYGEWFQASTGTAAYGPVVGSSVSVSAATLSGSLLSYTRGLIVPRSGTATFSFDLRNTGNVPWPIHSWVRVSSPSDAARTSTWLASKRPTALTSNATRPGVLWVAPGEVGRFTFAIGGNGRAPGTYSETFGAGWEAWRAMVLSVPVTYTLR
jgi:SpoIID/LytB domain protein